MCIINVIQDYGRYLWYINCIIITHHMLYIKLVWSQNNFISTNSVLLYEGNLLGKHPVFCTDLQIWTMFGFGGWVGFEKPGLQISQKDWIFFSKVCIFFCGGCSDWGVGGYISTNPNILRICKSVRKLGRSLSMRKRFLFSHEFTEIMEFNFYKNWDFPCSLQICDTSWYFFCKEV